MRAYFNLRLKGFTLIELILVATIMIILSVIGFTIFINGKTAANDAKRKADIDAITKAYEVNYNPITGLYRALLASDFAGGFPKQPDGTDYNYPIPSGQTATSYQICTPLGSYTGVCTQTNNNCYCKTNTQGEPYVAPTPTFIAGSGTPTPMTSCIGIDDSAFAIHSFIFPNYPPALKDYLFDKAASTGKKFIRFDFGLTTIEPNNDNADPNTSGIWNWGPMDDMVTRAKNKGLQVVGTLGGSASWIAAPAASPVPSGFTYNPNQAPIDRSMLTNGEYAEFVRETVSHYKGPLEVSFWEVWNEPNTLTLYDGPASPSLYVGSPYTYADFAEVLRVAYDTVKAADPTDSVLFPGVIFGTTVEKTWTQNLKNHPSVQNKYDIANIHIRGPISVIQTNISQAVSGFPGKEVWVTEHGYTADYQHQQDPAYKGTDLVSGEQKQAEYYLQSLPALIAGGADKVFVTLRDYASQEDPCQQGTTTTYKSRFCLEGLMTLNTTDIPNFSTLNYDRPSMCTFKRMTASGVQGSATSRPNLLDIFRGVLSF